MVKSKKNKKSNADVVYAKKGNVAATVNPFAEKAASMKKLNPFEVHINKEKFQILGRTCKHDKGLPGVSRAKAEKRRKETLAEEYRVQHKSNQFRDRRIGRHLKGALSDEVLNARFVADKLAQMKQGKAARFNLNDDEVLTHRGQTLEEIEQFRDERSDDDDDEGNEGLEASFTEAAHFGGDSNQTKDRQTAIDEMIAEQKRRKIEIAKDKDEVQDLTDKLDSNYKELMQLVGKMTKNEMREKQKPDDYDKIMREMIFEPRGEVTDKLLTEEELAKKQKEQLEKLEKERLKRMQADGDENVDENQAKHRSADDLDDGYFAYGEEEEEGTLAYNLEGELGSKSRENKNHQMANGDNETEDARDEESEDGDDESEEGEEESESEDEDEKSDTNSEDGEEDNLSDLKESDSEQETEEKHDGKNKKPISKSKTTPNSAGQQMNGDTDLPFTIEMPEAYDDFISLISKQSPDKQAIIVERLIKCNHPKLDGVNREKVVKLFAFLLQYINELFTDASQEDVMQQFEILSKLNPHIYDLVHLNPEKMCSTLLSVITKKYSEYRKNSKSYPSLETVIFFKLVSNYCSTSDFRHPVVTPCYIFIQHVLSRARVRTRQDIAMGLFLVTIILEFSHRSKRFLPAAFNYLLGVMYLSIPKRPIETLKIVPPFQSTGPMSKLLAVTEIPNKESLEEELMKSEDLVMTTFSIDFKIRALNTALKLTKDAIGIVGENVGSNYLADPLLDMMDRLPVEVYPEFVKKNWDLLRQDLEIVASKKLTKIVPPEKKPKALRLLEPRIETVYDDKRRPKLSKEKEEKAKLLHKLKRETKGAIREIRRDTEFLQKMRIQQKIQSDTERREKVKRIFQEASVQQSELNELDRLKKKKKF